MREIVLDTETTGLDPAEGHRIVEIGAVELLNHVPTGQVFHRYLNPDRPMPPEAEAVHGLSSAFLADKPRFTEAAADFLAFIGPESRLVIHNAGFDLKFLNHELAASGFPEIPNSRTLDTLAIARRRFPGAPASLDALCRRFGIDNTMRTRHGALLDSEILAEVYLELIGGRQPGLALATGLPADGGAQGAGQPWRPYPRPSPPVRRLTAGEEAAHRAFVAGLGPEAVWAGLGY
ncbi:MAG: DNA polymerase III subunit epsilon [Paracoccaceae bacterium]